MVMQPGEASWASWKRGGGPHREDRPPGGDTVPIEPVGHAAVSTSVEQIIDSATVEDFTSGATFPGDWPFGD